MAGTFYGRARLLGVALCGALLCGGSFASQASAQTAGTRGDRPAMPPATVEASLHEMSNAAGVIFSGQVLSVRTIAGAGGDSGAVEVRFRVDQAVRGCSAGGVYVLREWAGLWAGGDQRYRVGQRLLMLLRSPGAAGLSSPVGGMDGAIPIRGVESEIGAGAVSAATVTAGSAGPATMVDLRWVAARMLRSAPYLGAAAVTGTASATSVAPVATSAGTEAGSVAAAGASVGTVMSLLGGWEAERAAQ